MLFLCYGENDVLQKKLPNFSETAKIRQHPVFSPPEDQQERLTIELPETIQITHVR